MDLARIILLLSAFAGVSTRAREARASELPSAFFISKSENRNQVHYAVAVDANCAPAGNAPVRPYWRMLEEGATQTAPLLAREQRVYGIARQSVTRRSTSSGRIALALRALPKRPLTIITAKGSTGACLASVYTVIQGEPAQLYSIHLVLNWLGLDSLVIKGWAKSDRRVLRETLEP